MKVGLCDFYLLAILVALGRSHHKAHFQVGVVMIMVGSVSIFL